MKQYTAREQFAAFEKGEYLDTCFYFYDWFCNDKSLERKSKGLMAKAKKFAALMNIDLDTHYIWFKNNCPMHGTLYDDFRFARVDNSDTVWTVQPALGYHGETHGTCEVWSSTNDWKTAIATAPSWREFLKKQKELTT